MAMFGLFVGLVALMLHPSIQAADIDPYMTTKANQQRVIVDKHNSLRRAVKPPARNMLRMEWNSQAASHAQSWANQCSLKQSTYESRMINGKSCGENIFMSSIIVPWPYVIQKWFDEGKNFQYGSGATSPNARIGVYTQVVWYNSYQVGCAVAVCPGQPVYKYFYVCRYCPAGNRIDQINTPYKKGTPCGDCPKACDKGLCTNPCKHSDKYINCPGMKKTYGCGIPLMKDCQASYSSTHAVSILQTSLPETGSSAKPIVVFIAIKTMYSTKGTALGYPGVLKIVMTSFWLHVCLLALVLYQSGVQGSDHEYDAFMTTKGNQQKKIVNKHNSLRRSVQPPASNMLKMEWNSEIASNAQHWANQCTLKQGTAERKKINGVHCGENIFTSSTPFPWSKVIQNWYDNGKNFQYGIGATSPKAKTGVYTQATSHVAASMTTLQHQKEIVEKHNALRRTVQPPASNMLRMTEAIKIAGLTSKAAEKEIVDKHNALRRSVKPPASNMLRMEWDPKAAKNAQHWAEKCTFSHSPGRKRTVNGTLCGENIFMATAAASWSTAIESWYDESKYYKYGVGPVTPGAMTGHYTQTLMMSLAVI
ncbi:hypothetical protein JRQ81_001387 [Phrynocephalus forsythii]|uniref:SCP domain-containing protein n=1 Tax=Phrynocephalus forsythii TaxID=171643 RepID=A0A9Q1B8C6_9SAUR|nr:hypothetical protein JRQ81_001387 [Phrynocephalus forsythii]